MKKIAFEDKTCLQCGKDFFPRKEERQCMFKKRKFCSRKCSFKYHKGEHSWKWNNGIRKLCSGYLQYCKNNKYLHRFIMENHLGRKLKGIEIVHHINGNVSDNKIKNLRIMTRSAHTRYHDKDRLRDKKGRYI